MIEKMLMADLAMFFLPSFVVDGQWADIINLANFKNELPSFVTRLLLCTRADVRRLARLLVLEYIY
jgi:hypothetical protein